MEWARGGPGGLWLYKDRFALRPQMQGGLLEVGTGGVGEGGRKSEDSTADTA